MAVDDVAAAFADLVVEESPETIALSGGSTASRCYSVLRERSPDWSRVSVLFGDERVVPIASEDSNEGMARRVLLDHLSVGAVHSMVGHGAAAYDALVRSMPPLELVHLGLGPDGHTASLFPGAPQLDEMSAYVVDAGDAAHPHPRITFTFPAIARSQLVVVTVEGPSKRDAWQRVVSGDPSCPAQHVTGTRVVWLVDAELVSGTST